MDKVKPINHSFCSRLKGRKLMWLDKRFKVELDVYIRHKTWEYLRICHGSLLGDRKIILNFLNPCFNGGYFKIQSLICMEATVKYLKKIYSIFKNLTSPYRLKNHVDWLFICRYFRRNETLLSKIYDNC